MNKILKKIFVFLLNFIALIYISFLPNLNAKVAGGCFNSFEEYGWPLTFYNKINDCGICNCKKENYPIKNFYFSSLILDLLYFIALFYLIYGLIKLIKKIFKK